MARWYEGRGERAKHLSDIWRFVCLFTLDEGLPPTLEEVAEAVGLPKSTAYSRLCFLVELGVLDRAAGKLRLLRVVVAHPDFVNEREDIERVGRRRKNIEPS